MLMGTSQQKISKKEEINVAKKTPELNLIPKKTIASLNASKLELTTDSLRSGVFSRMYTYYLASLGIKSKKPLNIAETSQYLNISRNVCQPPEILFPKIAQALIVV